MSIQLTIECHGIGPFVASTDDKRAAVFLCEAPPNIVPNQITYVRFPRTNYPESNRRRPEGNDRQFGHVTLNRERLSIVGAVAQSDAELKIDRFEDPRFKNSKNPRPTRRDGRSLRWLPKIKDLAPGHGALKSDYFTNPVNAQPRLIARVDFTQGRLGTTGVANVQVPFRSKTKSIKMPMARDIQVELEIESDHFVLRCDPFEGTRDPANDLRFEGEGAVTIVIGNEPANDMEVGTPPILPIDVIGQNAADEWVYYFSLCEKTPDDPLLPHLARRPGTLTGCSRPEYDASDLLIGSPSNRETFASIRTAASATPQPPKWAFFAYLAFDNDLRDVGRVNVEEIAKADPSKVGVVVLLDVPETATKRLVLEKDGLKPDGQDVGNLDAGDPKTLTDFLTAAKSLRPSEYRAVILSTHGNGIRDVIPARRGRGQGFNFDNFIASFGKKLSPKSREILFEPLSLAPDDSAGDVLDNQELEQGLRDALLSEGPFDIVGFDACFMGLVEIGYQLRLCGKYMVASQEDLTATGWPYATILDSLGAGDPPREAAIAIVEAFKKSTKTQEGATLSAVDLDAMTPLARALDNLGGALLGKVPDLIDSLAAAQEKARAFDDFDYIDLYGFASAIEEELGKAMPAGADRDKVLTAAGAVTAEIDKAVVAVNLDPGKSNAHGLSVYVPNAPVIPEYHKLSISTDAPRWHDFVVEYGNNR